MRARRIGLAGLVVLATLQCSEKKSSFFQPVGLDLLGDTTAPVFSGHRPPSSVNIFSGRGGAMVTVVDEQSGIDVSSVIASLPGGSTLPVAVESMSATTATLTIDLSGLTPETTAKIGVRARDNAGNEGLTTFDWLYDPLAPRIDAGFPAAEIESSEDSHTFTIPTVIEDASFQMAFGRIFAAGADGACGGGDDELLEEVETGQTSSELSLGVSNPVPSGGDPLRASYCLQVEARDAARGETGDPDPNVTFLSSLTRVQWSRPPALTAAFLGIPGGSGDLAPGRYTVEVRVGATGPVVGQVDEEFRVTGSFPLLNRNPTHLAMTDVSRVVELDSFTPLSGGGSLAPAQTTSPLVGFNQYGWCSEQDLLQFTPAVVRMRDASGALVHQTTLGSLPDNPSGTADPLCGFVVVPDPDRIVEIELDTFQTHVRLIGACQRNAPADDLVGTCVAP